MPVATESPVRRVPFNQLVAFPELFATYCTDYPALRDFFAGDFRDETARRSAADRAADHLRDRDALADVLRDQNTHLAAGEGLDATTHDHVNALRDPASVAVVTGQQVGLFGGPLYTLYKTLTALQLAEQLAEETGRPIVPVFWLEGEDHDLDEVTWAYLLQRNGLVPVRYDALGQPHEGNAGPVGRLRLSEQIEDVLSKVDALLPPSDFKPVLVECLHAAYRPGATLTDAFARFLRLLLPDAGLVFINADDQRLKALAAPLFRREIEEPEASARRVQAAGEQLKAAGHHQQVHGRPANLFMLEEEGRLALDYENDRFVLRGTERTYSKSELLDLLKAAPERFSPNVVLRPLVQDTLLPTALYVAGPGEVSYFAQYRGVYQEAGVPMPLIYPRASATLVERKVQRVLDRAGLALPDMAEDSEQLFQRVVKAEMGTDVDARFREAVRPMHQALNGLKPQVEAVDGSLNGSVEAARAALVQTMEDLKGKVVRAEKRKQDDVQAQLDKARVNLFPGGKLQERIISPLYFLNKYSLDLPKRLRTTLSLDTTGHQVVEL